MLNIDGKKNYSILLNSLAPNKNTIFGNVNISDYSTIKNGSYKKLLKSYYSELDAQNKKDLKTISKDKIENSISNIDQAKKNAANLKTKATDLTSSIKSIKNNINDEAVSNFVNKYNSMQNLAANSNKGNIDAASLGLANVTAKNAKNFAKIGITFDNNNLSFDSEKFKTASIEDKQKAFNSNYLKEATEYAQRISNYSQENMKNSTTYNSAAIQNFAQSGLLFNDFV